MKKILTLMLAVSLWVSSFTFGAQAFGGRYVLDGLDEDYLIMLNSTDEDSQLGSLSAKYESSGNPGTVSGGGDYGGVSFGAYQFSSRFDVPKTFFNWCISSGKGIEIGNRLKAAYKLDENTYGEKFIAEWKLIAQESPDTFLSLQHGFTKARFYDVVVEKLEKRYEGFDVDNYTIALKNVIWSRAVHNGVNSDVITAAIDGLGGFKNQPEDVLIRAIYRQASKLVDEPPTEDSVVIVKSSAEKYGIDPEVVTGKYLYYHSRNTSDIQVSVYRRVAVREPAEALEMYVAAGGVLTPDPELPDEPGTDIPENPDPNEPDSPDINEPDTELPDNPDSEPSLIVSFFEAVIMLFEMIISFFTTIFA